VHQKRIPERIVVKKIKTGDVGKVYLMGMFQGRVYLFGIIWGKKVAFLGHKYPLTQGGVGRVLEVMDQTRYKFLRTIK
jgi:hypothetical protein